MGSFSPCFCQEHAESVGKERLYRMVLILTLNPMCSLEDNILMVSDRIKHRGDGREPHEINDSCFVIRFLFSCFLLQMYVFIARICKLLGLLQGSMHMIL